MHIRAYRVLRHRTTETIKVTARMRYVMRPAIISAVGTENIVVCLGQ